MKTEKLTRTEKLRRALITINNCCSDPCYWGVAERGRLLDSYPVCEFGDELKYNDILPRHLFIWVWQSSKGIYPFGTGEVLTTDNFYYRAYHLRDLADWVFDKVDGNWIVLIFKL